MSKSDGLAFLIVVLSSKPYKYDNHLFMISLLNWKFRLEIVINLSYRSAMGTFNIFTVIKYGIT